MGSRADFYVGLEPDTMEWLGSIAWDGYPGGIDSGIKSAKMEETFRARVTRLLESREDSTTPDMGWPWPWEDSQTTDFSYTFADGCVWGTNFGYSWYKVESRGDEDDGEDKPKVAFPNMKDRQKVNLGKRSGVTIITANGIYEGE